MRLLLILTTVFTLWNNTLEASEKQLVRVVNLNDPQSKTLSYFQRLLDDALAITEAKYGPYEIVQVDFNAAQNRSLTLLRIPNVLDVMHTMQEPDLDQKLLAVPYDLLNGLLGNRVFLVKKQNAELFNNISEDELKAKTACQGIHWRDADIMENNGYRVQRVVNFESIFKMLEKGRCDYFPRGVNEIDLDYARFNKVYGELAIAGGLRFEYDVPVHFYLGKHNELLAQRITEGIRQLGGRDYIDKLIENSEFSGGKRYIEDASIRVLKLKVAE